MNISGKKNSVSRGREMKVHVCLERGSSLLWLEHRVWERGGELEAEVVKRGWDEAGRSLVHSLKEKEKV